MTDAPSGRSAPSIRLVSYLSPGLPAGLFQSIAEVLASGLGRRVEVDFLDAESGPVAGTWPEGADLAFMCAPAYVQLRQVSRAALIPAAPVFDDDRNAGKPLYFSEVVVGPDSTASRLEDLGDVRWAVNDVQSLSGYRCVVDAFGADTSLVWSGGHLRSVDLIRLGEADAAAVDANVLAAHGIEDVRIVHTLGPHPVQPLVARPTFSHVAATARILLGTRFPEWNVTGFAPVSDGDYPDSLA